MVQPCRAATATLSAGAAAPYGAPVAVVEDGEAAPAPDRLKLRLRIVSRPGLAGWAEARQVGPSGGRHPGPCGADRT